MRVAVFRGDGIGPEIVDASLNVLKYLNSRFNLGLDVQNYPIGLSALKEAGTTLPEESKAAAHQADAIILGPLSTSDYPSEPNGGINVSAYLRRNLDLYANIRPCKTFPGLACKSPSMDVVIVRENTEGFYANRAMHAGCGEFAPSPDMAFALRRITATCSRRIAERAFELADTRRKRVTAIHKANVLKLTDGLFLRECRDIAKAYPSFTYDELIIDAAASQLVLDDGQLDTIVTTNLFGDILSNQAAALCGGLGTGASINHGTDHAMAQASHGSAPDIAGKGIANPVSMLLSIALLLRHLGGKRPGSKLSEAANRLEIAIAESLANPKSRTIDLGGSASTADVSDDIHLKLAAQ